MALELIDTQTTDSNGEASITYTGTGAGEIEFRAKVSTLLQESFVVTDCIAIDRAISTDYNDNIYNFGTSSRTRNATDTRFYGDRTGLSGANFSFKQNDINTGICFQLEVTSITNMPLVGVQKAMDSTNTQSRRYTPVSTGVYRFEVTSTSTKIYKDNVLLETYSDTESNKAQFHFRVNTGETGDFNYKNVLIYPL